MRVGLMCGGGGLVGIAWEIGALAGLRRGGGFDPSSATVIVGTSAGSVVGAQAALGKDFDEVFEAQRTPVDANTPGVRQPRDFTSAFAEIMPLFQTEGGLTQEISARIGKIAMTTEGLPAQEAFIRGFERQLGTDEWPDADLRVTAVDCETGKRLAWTKSDDVPLSRAVASSCAIPAYFPTITIHGRQYMDGGISGESTVPLLLDAGIDALLFVGPAVRMQQGARNAFDRLAAEREKVAAAGVAWHEVVPGEAFGQQVGMNLMDPTKRALGAELGLQDGIAAAERLSSLSG
jgi:NTE family protein